MPLFVVRSQGQAPVTVDASNWITALGQGLDAIGTAAAIDRLACEVLPNGTVIARDARSGLGYVVQPAGSVAFGVSDGDDENTVLMMQPGPDVTDRSAGPPRDAVAAAPDAGAPDADDVFEMEDDEDTVTYDSHTYDGAVDAFDTASFDAETFRVPVVEAPTVDTSGELTASDLTASDLTAHGVLLPAQLLDRIRLAGSAALAWQAALDLGQQLTSAQAGSALRQEPDGSLRFVGATGPHAASLISMVLPAGTGVVGFSVDRRTSLLVSNPYSDPRFFRGVDQATGFQTHAILCVPVKAGDQVLGCLEWLNPTHAPSFDHADIERVEQVAAGLGADLLRRFATT